MLSTDVRAAEGLMVEDCQVDALAMVACCWPAAVRQLPKVPGETNEAVGSERAAKANGTINVTKTDRRMISGTI